MGIDLDKVYDVALPSFISGSDNVKGQRQIRAEGVFDDNILTLTKGDVFIYEAVRDYFKMKSPVEQRIEGRWFVFYEAMNEKKPTTKRTTTKRTTTKRPTTIKKTTTTKKTTPTTKKTTTTTKKKPTTKRTTTKRTTTTTSSASSMSLISNPILLVLSVILKLWN